MGNIGGGWDTSAAVEGNDEYVLDRQVFMLWLAARKQRQLKPSTRVKYAENAQLYLNWLREVQVAHPRALSSPQGRDAAVGEYRQYLLRSQMSGSAVNVALAAVRTFYLWRGLGVPQVAPAKVGPRRARVLDVVEQSRVLAAAEMRPARSLSAQARRARDYALVMVVLYSGLREAEVADLNIDDVELSAAGAFVWAPVPGGLRTRRQLPARVRSALLQWEAYRRELLGENRINAYFVAWRSFGGGDDRRGKVRRMSKQSVEQRVKKLGQAAGMERRIAPGVLRSTFARHVVEAEQDSRAVARMLRQAKPDAAQIRALRDVPVTGHPGRTGMAGSVRRGDPDQFVLDF